MPLEELVPGDVDLDVEVACRSAARSDLALAGQLDPGAGVDPGRDLDRDRATGPDPAVADWLPPAVNDGASFTGVTVTASAASSLSPPESVARTVRTADPLAFGATARVSTPPDTETELNRAGLVLPTTA